MKERGDDDRARPPRPGTGVTEDGRRLQVLTTYARRGSRLTPTQQAAWDRHADEWLIPESAVDEPSFVPARWFGREAPLVVEIGSGNGESVAAMAAARPSYDVLAFEVWRPGVASTFLNLEEAGADERPGARGGRGVVPGAPVRPGAAGGAVDVLPRPLAQEAAPQAAAGHAGVRGASPPRGSPRGRSGGSPRTGPTTPTRSGPCSTPSRCSRAARSSGGRSGR